MELTQQMYMVSELASKGVMKEWGENNPQLTACNKDTKN